MHLAARRPRKILFAGTALDPRKRTTPDRPTRNRTESRNTGSHSIHTARKPDNLSHREALHSLLSSGDSSLSHLAPVLLGESLASLAARIQDSRPAALTHLKLLGVQSLRDRQSLINRVSRAARVAIGSSRTDGRARESGDGARATRRDGENSKPDAGVRVRVDAPSTRRV